MTETQSGKKDPVIYQRHGHIGFITLNVPEKRNALNPIVWDSLNKAIGTAEKDEDARVVLLQGEGKSFCAGLDLSPDNSLFPHIMGPPSALQKKTLFRAIRNVQNIHTRMERLPKPTIAVIHAHCLGAGLELALCCDIRLCSAETLFALPEARLAIITDVGGLQRLPKVVGRGHAREIAFRGHRFDAQRARAINLVNHVYPDQKTLNTKAFEIAQEIAENPPLAVQGAKEVMLYDEDSGLDHSLNYNAARSSMIMPSEDLSEAISATMEKRKGEFKGK